MCFVIVLNGVVALLVTIFLYCTRILGKSSLPHRSFPKKATTKSLLKKGKKSFSTSDDNMSFSNFFLLYKKYITTYVYCIYRYLAQWYLYVYTEKALISFKHFAIDIFWCYICILSKKNESHIGRRKFNISLSEKNRLMLYVSLCIGIY